MDNVKLILVLVILLLEVACSKKREQAQVDCTPYVSPYMIEFPDNSIRKSMVEHCGDYYRATDLGQGSAVIEAPSLVVRLHDTTTGDLYLTTFTGQ